MALTKRIRQHLVAGNSFSVLHKGQWLGPFVVTNPKLLSVKFQLPGVDPPGRHRSLDWAVVQELRRKNRIRFFGPHEAEK